MSTQTEDYWKLENKLSEMGYDQKTISKIINIQKKIDSLQKFIDRKKYYSKAEKISFLAHISDSWHDTDISIDTFSGAEIEEILNALIPGIRKLIKYYEKESEELYNA